MCSGFMDKATLKLTVKLFQDQQRRVFEDAGQLEEAAKIRPFKTADGLPGNKWVRGFLTRHPDIKLKNAKKTNRVRIKVTYKDVEEFFLKRQQAQKG